MLAELEAALLSHWDRTGIGAPPPRRLSFMSIAGRVESAATTLLAFDDHARRPLLAVKVHRAGDAAARVRAEAAVLGELARIPDIAGSVPVVIYSGEVAGKWVLVQTVLDGIPMSGTGRRAAGDTALAFEWLERLQRARPSREDESLRGEIRSAIEALQATFTLTPRERDYLGSIDIGRAAACGAVLEHGDFAPHNILAGSGRVAVIDWTDGRTVGPALHDAFFFATTVRALRGSTDGTYPAVLRAFGRAFLDAGPERDRCLGSIRSHAAAVGVDPRALDPLFGIFLIRVAGAEADRLRAAHERGSWSSFALQVAAAERLDAERVVEAQPWIRFFGMVAAHGAVFGG